MDIAQTTIAGVRIAVTALVNRDADGRTVYVYSLEGAGLSHGGKDLKSGCQGGTAARGLEDLLCFLEHAGESHPDPEANFPADVCEWAAQHQEDIGMVRFEMEEGVQP